MMHLFIRAEASRREAATIEMAQETRVRLMRTFAPTQLLGYQRAEFVAGDATLDITTGEIVSLFLLLLRRAEA